MNTLLPPNNEGLLTKSIAMASNIALRRLTIDVLAHHPGQAGQKQKRDRAPGRKRAQGSIAQIADRQSGRRHKRHRPPDSQKDGANEKKRTQSLSGHLTVERPSV